MRVNPHGAHWTQTTVSAVEHGTRSCSLVEVAALLWAFRAGLDDLLAGDDTIDTPFNIGPIDGVARVRLPWMRMALTQPSQHRPQEPFEAHTVEGVQLVTSIANPPVATSGSFLPGFDDATMKAARSIGRDPAEVHRAAVRLWRKSLPARRDDLLGDVSGVPARTVQARRGHITRQLLDELRDQLGVTPATPGRTDPDPTGAADRQD